MSIRKREGNRPDRRVLPAAESSPEQRDALIARITYAPDGHHKRRPGDYGLDPPFNPRPSKSLCDAKGQRQILMAEAHDLFVAGIRKGMFSRPGANGLPKYVWAVDAFGDVYESKTRPEHEHVYHGYRLGDDDSNMRRYVIEEWNRR